MIINLDFVYPIGSIYMSVSSQNPSKWFGGTWTAWGSGRVPVGVASNQTEFATVEKTGGEKTHTLTYAEMPTHNHGQTIYWSDGGAGTGYVGITFNSSGNAGNKFWASYDAGGGQAHNNLQPYITCYMWKRTA